MQMQVRFMFFWPVRNGSRRKKWYFQEERRERREKKTDNPIGLPWRVTRGLDRQILLPKASSVSYLVLGSQSSERSKQATVKREVPSSFLQRLWKLCRNGGCHHFVHDRHLYCWACSSLSAVVGWGAGGAEGKLSENNNGGGGGGGGSSGGISCTGEELAGGSNCQTAQKRPPRLK